MENVICPICQAGFRDHDALSIHIFKAHGRAFVGFIRRLVKGN